jgi:ABC-type proline/glycine betaine transport system permease subunit
MNPEGISSSNPGEKKIKFATLKRVVSVLNIALRSLTQPVGVGSLGSAIPQGWLENANPGLED